MSAAAAATWPGDSSDCDDGKLCHTAHCQSQVCTYVDIQCDAPDSCNTSACDPTDGTCKTSPGGDGTMCTTTDGLGGTCTSGSCLPLPTCYDVNNSFNYIYCDYGPEDDSTDPSTSFSSPTQVLDTYACATGETGPEVAYQFIPDADGDVTVALTPMAPSGADGGTGTAPDLDLIVLDQTCDAKAACMNPALAGGGYAGITAGNGVERLTFKALSSHTYYFVVDAKNGAMGNFRLEIEACGSCQPTPTTTLACNQSMPLAGDTSKGKSDLSMYTCTQGTGTQSVMAPGNEQAFLFNTVAPSTQQVTAKVVNASKAVTLFALPSNLGACDPTSCLGSATATGTAPNMSASLTFSADPDPFSGGPAHYWVVIDTPAAGADATFGLQINCAAYCSNANGDTLDCSTKTASANNGVSGSTNDISAWGPTGAACGGMSNLSGPEYAYLFHKTTTSNKPIYTLTLAALTTGKHLGMVVLDAGATSPAACDPSKACAVTAPVTVAATTTVLASTGTYVAAATGTTEGGTDGKTAVLTLTTGTTAERWYWVIVDGVNGDVSDYALSISAGCP